MKLFNTTNIAFSIVAIDAIGGVLFGPLLSFRVNALNGTVITLSYLFSIFAVILLLASPLLGIISDKLGRKFALLTAALGGAIGWFILAMADSIGWLYLGSAFLGIGAAHLPIVQSYITDISRTRRQRTILFGTIGVIIGIASIIGPFVSSFFIASGPTFIFLSLAILFAASALLIDFYFEHEEVSLGKIKKKDFHPLLFLKNFGEKREVIIIFLIWFVIGLAMSGTNSVFSWYLQDNLSLSQQAILYIFTGAGILTVISQGPGLKHFWLRFWSERKLALSAPVALTIGFLIMALPFFAWFIVGYIIEQLGRPIFRIIITSDIAEEANKDQRGSALGALSSVGAIAMIFGPLLFGLLFNIKPALVFVTSAGLAFITLILTILLLRRKLTSIDR